MAHRGRPRHPARVVDGGRCRTHTGPDGHTDRDPSAEQPAHCRGADRAAHDPAGTGDELTARHDHHAGAELVDDRAEHFTHTDRHTQRHTDRRPRIMIKHVFAAAVAAAGLLVAAPVALAAETPSCADALVVYSDAAKAAATARSDDQAAADAKAADEAVVKAQAELDAAIAADNAVVPPLTQDSNLTIRAKLALATAKARAAETDAAALAATADKTDATALGKAAADARAAADKACKGADGATVTATPAPSAPASVVVVPDTSDGVATGSR